MFLQTNIWHYFPLLYLPSSTPPPPPLPATSVLSQEPGELEKSGTSDQEKGTLLR